MDTFFIYLFRIFSFCLFFHLDSGYSVESHGKGMEKLDLSAKDNQYLFLFFYKEQNPRTVQGQQIFDQTLQSLNAPIQSIKINVADPKEQAIVEKYKVQRAPMPLVLVIAPSGAITGGFPGAFTADQLRNAIISPGMASTLEGLQNRKLVFLCIQNEGTRDNEKALQGVEDLSQDPRFHQAVKLILIDPSDKREVSLLDKFEVDQNITQAYTVFLAPPGNKIGKYIGETNKEQIISDLQKASCCCCPGGCCPGGCCSGGCCGN